jgi:hypothetical protein
MTTQIQAPDAIEASNFGLLRDSIGPAIRLLRNLLSSRIVAAFEPFGLRSGTFSTMAPIAANPGRLVAAGGQATHPAHAPGGRCADGGGAALSDRFLARRVCARSRVPQSPLLCFIYHVKRFGVDRLRLRLPWRCLHANGLIPGFAARGAILSSDRLMRMIVWPARKS